MITSVVKRYENVFKKCITTYICYYHKSLLNIAIQC